MRILILGGDARYKVLIDALKEKYDVDTLGFDETYDLSDIDIKNYSVIILPISGINDKYQVKSNKGLITLDEEFFKNASKDIIIYTGITNETLKKMVGDLNLISFLSDEEVNKENNDITTSGIVNLIENKDYSNICILGYGNIAKGLEEKLKAYNLIFGVKDYNDFKILGNKCFYTCNPNDMKEVFKNSDLIINTVPSNIITSYTLDGYSSDIIDIASYPYGASKDVIDSNPNYKIYSGIPAKYDPIRSGKILLKKIEKEIGGNV